MYRSLLSAVLLLSCQNQSSPTLKPVAVPPSTAPAASIAPASQAAPPHLPPEEEAKFLEIAATYTQWGRVDETPNFSPLDCRAPTVDDMGKASQVRESQAMREHGQKLYYLFAKEKQHYLSLAQTLGPDHKGQVIVKEAWTSIEIDAPPPPAKIEASFAPPPPITYKATKDGKLLQTDQPASLFIMRYVGAAQENTDEGWWYATVSPDRKTVTASGVISSCQGCHSQAKYQRLFGLKNL